MNLFQQSFDVSHTQEASKTLGNYGVKTSSSTSGVAEKVRKCLEQHADKKHQAFIARIIPTVDPQTILGVKIPFLRKLAKQLKDARAVEEYLTQLPHRYLEENQLHVLLINECAQDFAEVQMMVETFVPYVDNWSVSDAFAPRVFKDNPQEGLGYLHEWLTQDNLWLQRIAIRILIGDYTSDLFDEDTMHRVADCALSDAPERSDEFYLNMAVAWYLSMVLVRHPESGIVLFDPVKLPQFVHNKALQKARESRVSPKEQKDAFQALKI